MKMTKHIIPVALAITLAISVSAHAASGGPYEIADEKAANTSATPLLSTVMAVLNSHKSLKSIQENLVVNQYELRRARAGYGPRVDLTGSAGITNINDSTTRLTKNYEYFYGTGEVSLLLTQPIWDGFATRSRVRASKATVDSVTSRVIDNATTLALDGIISHVDLIWRKRNLKLAENNVVTHERILALTRDREATGADTLANVTQTQGRLVSAMTTLQTTKAELLKGEDSYRRLTEQPVPTSLGAVKQPLKMFSNPEEVLALAKTNNPKVIAYLADVRAAEANKELSEASYYPTINIEAGPSFSNTGAYNDGENWTASVDVLGTVSWNLFNSGADYAATQAASARIREARQTAHSFMDDLKLEIQNSWTDYQTAITQLGYHEEALVYNLQTRDFYMEQFLIGQRTLLDVLNAEGELYNSEVQAVTARANIIISTYTLYALAGLLLPELDIQPEQVLKAQK